jgi:hypothetical protein
VVLLAVLSEEEKVRKEDSLSWPSVCVVA